VLDSKSQCVCVCVCGPQGDCWVSFYHSPSIITPPFFMLSLSLAPEDRRLHIISLWGKIFRQTIIRLNLNQKRRVCMCVKWWERVFHYAGGEIDTTHRLDGMSEKGKDEALYLFNTSIWNNNSTKSISLSAHLLLPPQCVIHIPSLSLSLSLTLSQVSSDRV